MQPQGHPVNQPTPAWRRAAVGSALLAMLALAGCLSSVPEPRLDDQNMAVITVDSATFVGSIGLPFVLGLTQPALVTAHFVESQMFAAQPDSYTGGVALFTLADWDQAVTTCAPLVPIVAGAAGQIGEATVPPGHYVAVGIGWGESRISVNAGPEEPWPLRRASFGAGYSSSTEIVSLGGESRTTKDFDNQGIGLAILHSTPNGPEISAEQTMRVNAAGDSCGQSIVTTPEEPRMATLWFWGIGEVVLTHTSQAIPTPPKVTGLLASADYEFHD